MVYREKIDLQSNDKAVTFHNITEEVKEIIKRSNISNGIVSIFSSSPFISISLFSSPTITELIVIFP